MSTPDLRTYWPAADTMGPGIVRAIEDYAQACAEEAVERCADVCDSFASIEGIAQQCATAVRALKEKK